MSLSTAESDVIDSIPSTPSLLNAPPSPPPTIPAAPLSPSVPEVEAEDALDKGLFANLGSETVPKMTIPTWEDDDNDNGELDESLEAIFRPHALVPSPQQQLQDENGTESLS